MDDRAYALFGFLGPLTVYASIALSLALSPWFNWESNALSDLGHPIQSSAAAVFNFGLLLAGFFMMIYALTAFRSHARISSACLLVSTFLVQALSIFNEAYGALHYAVATLHFVMLSVTSLVYFVERKSTLALLTFVAVLLSWLLYGVKLVDVGVAVPETFSKLILLWIIGSAIQIYRESKQTRRGSISIQ